MTETTETMQVRVSHRYAFPPERVFDAWLDPARAAKFLFATPTGTVIRCEIDARVGGEMVIVDRRPDMGDTEHLGKFVEIDRPRRLVFDFAVPAYGAAWTRVTVEIAATADGCELTLTHEGVLESYEEQTKGGWAMILGRLEEAAGAG
jgi:uncharacterized protein YndB with AHSA1/START domain